MDRLPSAPLQTTRVSPGFAAFSAEARLRAFGTFPPAGGPIDLSGAGSGQYEGRSRCAIAVAGSIKVASAATTHGVTRLGVAPSDRRALVPIPARRYHPGRIQAQVRRSRFWDG